MKDAGDSFAGAAFHCYAGDVGDQDKFHSAYPDKDIYFTECTGTFHGNWWSDLKVSLLFFLINRFTLTRDTVVHEQHVSRAKSLADATLTSP